MTTVENSDDFFTTRHKSLLRIAAIANIFTWIVIFVNILLAGARIIEIQNSYLIQSRVAGSVGNPDFLAMIGKDPLYATSVAVDILSIFLRGVVYGLILKGISLGLNMIVETDMNYKEKSAGGDNG
jgi:hypothetical protein